MKLRTTTLILLLLFFLIGQTFGESLDGKNVILVVSEHRAGDPEMEAVRKKLLENREEL